MGWSVLSNNPLTKWKHWDPPLLLTTISCGPLDVISVEETSMTITSDVEGRRPTYDTVIEARITLEVDLNIGGLLCGAPSEEVS